MTEKLVASWFNHCPICAVGGKRVLLELPKGDEYTNPCEECGSIFGKFFYNPKRKKSSHDD